MFYKNGIWSENSIPKYDLRTIYVHFTLSVHGKKKTKTKKKSRRKGKKKNQQTSNLAVH